MPGGVPAAAVTVARDMPDEGALRVESVAVAAVDRGLGDPPAVAELHEVTRDGVNVGAHNLGRGDRGEHVVDEVFDLPELLGVALAR